MWLGIIHPRWSPVARDDDLGRPFTCPARQHGCGCPVRGAGPLHAEPTTARPCVEVDSSTRCVAPPSVLREVDRDCGLVFRTPAFVVRDTATHPRARTVWKLGAVPARASSPPGDRDLSGYKALPVIAERRRGPRHPSPGVSTMNASVGSVAHVEVRARPARPGGPWSCGNTSVFQRVR